MPAQSNTGFSLPSAEAVVEGVLVAVLIAIAGLSFRLIHRHWKSTRDCVGRTVHKIGKRGVAIWATATSRLHRIRRRKRFVVGVLRFPPFVVLPSEGLGLEGFYPALIRQVAEATGLRADLQLIGWREVHDKLKSGEIDFAVPVFETPMRLSYATFAAKLHSIPMCAVTTNPEIENYDDLRREDVLIAVPDGAASWEFAVTHLDLEKSDRFKVVANPNLDDLIELAIKGEVDVAICDYITATEYQKRHPDIGCRIICQDRSLPMHEIGVMLPKRDLRLKEWIEEHFLRAAKNRVVARAEVLSRYKGIVIKRK